MRKLKVLLMVLMFVVFLIPSVFAKDIDVSFTWSANTEPDMGGYAIFERKDGEKYDYTKYIDLDCVIVDGGCYTDSTNKVNIFNYTVNVPDGKLTTFYWVFRARDKEPEPNWSNDSNEVYLSFDLTPLAAITDFAGVYNGVTKTLDFAWMQNDAARVTHWKLFKSTVSGGNYVEVGTIVWDGTSSQITASMSADVVAPGGEYFFVIVSFGENDEYSPNSNEVKIDRLAPSVPIKLRVILQ